MQIVWKKDKENNTLEGWVNDVMLFDIEIKETYVTIYQMKEIAGNYIDKNTLEEAKLYCEDKLLPKYLF